MAVPMGVRMNHFLAVCRLGLSIGCFSLLLFCIWPFPLSQLSFFPASRPFVKSRPSTFIPLRDFLYVSIVLFVAIRLSYCFEQPHASKQIQQRTCAAGHAQSCCASGNESDMVKLLYTDQAVLLGGKHARTMHCTCAVCT